MVDEASSHGQIAIRIADSTSSAERDALRNWVFQLLEIRKSTVTSVKKAKQALAVTLESNVIWPALKLMSRELKRIAWDNRGLKGRFALGGAAIGMAFFGGQSAGIAALGMAVGVPLWVVLGAGGAFAAALYQELSKSAVEKTVPTTTYTVIDAIKEDEKLKS